MVGRIKEAVAYFNIESGIALAVSLVINIFVLSVFAKGFYGREQGDIGLENAGQFLGRMKYIWAVGLLAAGKPSSTPILHYYCQMGTYTEHFSAVSQTSFYCASFYQGGLQWLGCR